MKVISTFSIIFTKASVPLGLVSACMDVFAPLLDYSFAIAILSMLMAATLSLLWFKKYRKELPEGETDKHWSFASMVLAVTASCVFGLLAVLHQNAKYEGKGILATHIPALGKVQQSIAENLNITKKVHADTTHLKREIAALKHQLEAPEREKRAKLLRKIEVQSIPGLEKSVHQFGLKAQMNIDIETFKNADTMVLEELSGNLFTIGSALYTIVKRYDKDPNITEEDSKIFQERLKKITIRHNPKHGEQMSTKFSKDGTLTLETNFSKVRWKSEKDISFASHLAMLVKEKN